jgi:hypothetical protein
MLVVSRRRSERSDSNRQFALLYVLRNRERMTRESHCVAFRLNERVDIPRTLKSRRITGEIALFYHRGASLVEARFNAVKTYTTVDQVPACARPRFRRGRWRSDIELTRFARTELSALEDLVEAMRLHRLEEPLALGAAIAELRAARPEPRPFPRRPVDTKIPRPNNLGPYLGRAVRLSDAERKRSAETRREIDD